MNMYDRIEKLIKEAIENRQVDCKRFYNWQFFNGKPVSIDEMQLHRDFYHTKNILLLKIDLIILNVDPKEIDPKHYYSASCKEWMTKNNFKEEWSKRYKKVYLGER